MHDLDHNHHHHETDDEQLALLHYMLHHNEHHLEEFGEALTAIKARGCKKAAAYLQEAIDLLHQADDKLEASINALEEEK